MTDGLANRSAPLLPAFSTRWSGPVDDPEKVIDLEPTDLIKGLDTRRLHRMLVAGEELTNIYRVLAKTNDNIVGLLLKDQGTFYEWDHYPKGDCYDHETFCQYYYHAHRGASGEHGHFHTFQRSRGMPAGVAQLPLERDTEWPKGTDVLAHLTAISMDRFGMPSHLFSTNRWVTGENLFGANDIIRMLDRFEMDLISPSWVINRWISALVTLFRPQIEQMLHKRDGVLRQQFASRPDDDVLEDRELEITAMTRIDHEKQIAAVKKVLG